MSFLRKQESILSFCGHLLPKIPALFKQNDIFHKNKTSIPENLTVTVFLPVLIRVHLWPNLLRPQRNQRQKKICKNPCKSVLIRV